MPRLISLNVGLPRDVAWRGATVHTGIWKQAVSDRRMVRRLNIDGDGQGDLAGHGGEQRAVMVYQLDSYRHWEHHLNRNDFVYGQFGENFTVEGLPDDEVCIGDRYRIGGAAFEVTQPRVTCYRVGIRMDEPQMAALLVSHRRPGFYFRVIQEGLVGAGDEIVKMAEGAEHVTIAEVDGLLYLPGHPRDGLERALRVQALSPGWKGSLQALLVQHDNGSPGRGNAGLTTTLPPPAWTGFRVLRVARVEPETADVVSLVFAAPDGSPLPAAIAGQFLVLRVRPKPELPPVLRSYSLSGAPDAGVYRISVKREPMGAVSNFLHRSVKAGDSLEVAAPRGSFTLQQDRDPVVLLSAGIGATPVMAMLYALVSRNETQRPVWWLQGARNRGEHPFADESRRLISEVANGRRYIAYSQPEPADQMGRDFDAAGHLDIATLEQLGVPRQADFYLCGPAGFLAAFTAGLKGWGVQAQRIHREIFGPGESITPGIAAPKTPPGPPRSLPGAGPGAGPQVSFARSGVTASWGPAFQSLLEFAEACHVPAAWSCRTGVCHTCECGLVGGAVEYQPEPLEPAAEGNLLICCSRPKGDVEIDL
ncbi:MAG TPA: MOSC and FAD-binding oxidoreductase domain-containing protein [Bryobacteraceae bacterium]|nr:MOSC and FAD-binding oxidoreductase domain-containing protein [Bryobacteraceae bacterium]